MRAVLSTTFRSLRVRNYRIFATGQLVKLVGVWMMFTAQDWLVLDLSHNSPGALGTVTALQFIAGAAAHPLGRQARRPVRQAPPADRARTPPSRSPRSSSPCWWPPAWSSSGTSSSSPPCSASPTRSRPRSVSRSSPSWSNCRCCRTRSRCPRPPSTSPGSAGRRWPASRWRCFHTGPVFLIATALADRAGLQLQPDAPGRAVPQRRGRPRRTPGSSTASVTCGSRPDLLLPIGLMAVVGMIGFNFPVTLAALAKINFHAGPSSFGLLTTSLAVGALGGALAGSAAAGPARGVRGARPPPWPSACWSSRSGSRRPSWSRALLLVPTGFFSIFLAQAANHRVQMGVDAEYPGPGDGAVRAGLPRHHADRGVAGRLVGRAVRGAVEHLGRRAGVLRRRGGGAGVAAAHERRPGHRADESAAPARAARCRPLVRRTTGPLRLTRTG